MAGKISTPRNRNCCRAGGGADCRPAHGHGRARDECRPHRRRRAAGLKSAAGARLRKATPRARPRSIWPGRTAVARGRARRGDPAAALRLARAGGAGRLPARRAVPALSGGPPVRVARRDRRGAPAQHRGGARAACDPARRLRPGGAPLLRLRRAPPRWRWRGSGSSTRSAIMAGVALLVLLALLMASRWNAAPPRPRRRRAELDRSSTAPPRSRRCRGRAAVAAGVGLGLVALGALLVLSRRREDD